jgi:hypothetical protein
MRSEELCGNDAQNTFARIIGSIILVVAEVITNIRGIELIKELQDGSAHDALPLNRIRRLRRAEEGGDGNENGIPAPGFPFNQTTGSRLSSFSHDFNVGSLRIHSQVPERFFAALRNRSASCILSFAESHVNEL